MADGSIALNRSSSICSSSCPIRAHSLAAPGTCTLQITATHHCLSLGSPSFHLLSHLLPAQVPAFPEPLAKEILARELPLGAFKTVSALPVSSASLGQVYRATLASDGREARRPAARCPKCA